MARSHPQKNAPQWHDKSPLFHANSATQVCKQTTEPIFILDQTRSFVMEVVQEINMGIHTCIWWPESELFQN